MRPARFALPRSFAARQAPPAARSFFTSTQPTAQTELRFSLPRQNLFRLARTRQSLFPPRLRSARYNSNKHAPSQRPDPTPHLGSPEPALSLSQRLKKLSREYGWAAVGVYFALSVLDFPFFFLLVRYVGADRIGHYEHVVVESLKSVIRVPFPGLGSKTEAGGASDGGELAEATAREGDWTEQLEEAEAQNQGAGASIWTQLTLAYVIHKSFIFVRVPLTAAILPKVVKTLRKWGYNIGKRRPKSG